MLVYGVKDLLKLSINKLIDNNERFDVSLEEESNISYDSETSDNEQLALLKRLYLSCINDKQ